MKEKLMYKCDHCRKVMATERGMERHEAQCLHNPDAFNCYNCACAYLGYYDDSYGHRSKDVPICAHTEDNICENWAARCSAYRRTDVTFNSRNIEQAEAALDMKEANDA